MDLNDWELLVRVRSMDGGEVGHFEVGAAEDVADLKLAIREAGGPPTWNQKLMLGHQALEDVDIAGEVFSAQSIRGAGGFVLLVTMEGCPDCKGPCSCSLCGCRPDVGLINYYGVCRDCGKGGGHKSCCRFCAQSFPSMCALDVHVKFVHPTELDDTQAARSQKALEQRMRASFKLPETAHDSWDSWQTKWQCETEASANASLHRQGTYGASAQKMDAPARNAAGLRWWFGGT
mmetsp:Transcript_1699/g.2598  ORF Transcript_1699/g.2598 Transcript_1699/m.2598 type:complete len:233 (-) Transcript_1699:81-779(-)